MYEMKFSSQDKGLQCLKRRVSSIRVYKIVNISVWINAASQKRHKSWIKLGGNLKLLDSNVNFTRNICNWFCSSVSDRFLGLARKLWRFHHLSRPSHNYANISLDSRHWMVGNGCSCRIQTWQFHWHNELEILEIVTHFIHISWTI